MLPPPPLLLRAATARPGSIAAAIASTPVSQPVTADDDDADEEFSLTTLTKPGTRHYVSKAQNAGAQDAKAVPVQPAARNPFNDDTAPTSFIPPVQRHQTPKAQYAGQATPQPAASQQAPATGKRRRLRQKKAQAEQAAQQNAPQAPAYLAYPQGAQPAKPVAQPATSGRDPAPSCQPRSATRTERSADQRRVQGIPAYKGLPRPTGQIPMPRHHTRRRIAGDVDADRHHGAGHVETPHIASAVSANLGCNVIHYIYGVKGFRRLSHGFSLQTFPCARSHHPARI